MMKSCKTTTIINSNDNDTHLQLTEDEKEVLNVLKFVNKKKLCPHCYNNLVDFIAGGKN